MGWTVIPWFILPPLTVAPTVFQNRLYYFATDVQNDAYGVNASPNQFSTLDGQIGGWMPGGGSTAYPYTVTVFQDRLYLFAISINVDDHRHYWNTFDGKNWSKWSPVPGDATTHLGQAVTVFQNRLYLFAIGLNDIETDRHHVNTFDGHHWSGWGEVPGGGTTNLADAVTVFQDRLYLFGIGIIDHHHYVNSFDGHNWSDWHPIPGGGTTNLADSVTVFQNRLYLFGVGINDHNHYVNTFDDDKIWSGWRLLPNVDPPAWTIGIANASTVFENHIYHFGAGQLYTFS